MNKMKLTPKELAFGIARLSQSELDELSEVLNTKYEISSNLYSYGFSSQKTSFDVFVTNHGGRKLALVKAIKELLDIGLREAKDIADSVPCVIAENVSDVEIDIYKSVLEDVGVTVEFV